MLSNAMCQSLSPNPGSWPEYVLWRWRSGVLFGSPLGLRYSAQLHSQELPAEGRGEESTLSARTLALLAALQRKLQATMEKGQPRAHTEGENHSL